MLWSFETGDVIRSTPTVTGGAVYFGSNDNHVYALDAQTGRCSGATIPATGYSTPLS